MFKNGPSFLDFDQQPEFLHMRAKFPKNGEGY